MYRQTETETASHFPVPARLDRPQPDTAVELTGPPAGQASPAPRRRFVTGKRALIAAAAVLVLAGAAAYGRHYWIVGRYLIATDDAYVGAHTTTLASKVAGYVASIPIADNATVHEGDVIATIDAGDYELAAAAAREKVATEQATIDRIGQQIVAQQANVEQANAQLISAQAGAKRAELEFARQKTLNAQQFASHQALEQAEANRDQAAAAVQNAQAAIDAARGNLDVLRAQQQEAIHTLAELKTAQDKAERDLSFTVIRAPVDGVFSNRAVQAGDYVQTGQRIASLVPLRDVYVDANFKETQLARIKPGQPVSISVDALPAHAIEGRVASLSPASGAVFSLLPPDNATGNFTKIVQRLPVRILVPDDVAAQRLLRPGMSVVVSVNTKPAQSSRGGGLASAAEAASAQR